jgi:hypothetical protein
VILEIITRLFKSQDAGKCTAVVRISGIDGSVTVMVYAPEYHDGEPDFYESTRDLKGLWVRLFDYLDTL